MQNLLKQKEKSRKRRQSIFSSSEFQEIERKRKKKQTAQKRKRKSLSLSKVSSSDSTTASYSKLETSASLKDSRCDTIRGSVQMEPPPSMAKYANHHVNIYIINKDVKSSVYIKGAGTVNFGNKVNLKNHYHQTFFSLFSAYLIK